MSERLPVDRADLNAIALYQKGLLFCILIYIIVVIGQVALPDVRFILGIVFLVIAVASTVFVFLLSMKLYNPIVGVVLGLLTLIPLLGLIVLLIINGKATSTLQLNGIRVGLLGAKSADLTQLE